MRVNQRGFSLLELLVALGIGGVVLLAAGTFYRTVAWTSRLDFSHAFLQNQATIVAEELRRQIEAASTIAACFPGSDCLADTCDGETTFLYLAQPDGTIYCFYRASSGQFMEYRQPFGGSGTHWNMLASASVPLIATTFDVCGSPPYSTCQTTTDIAYVSFRLQATQQLGGASVAPTVSYSMGIAKRN